jgi:hypothetical protein
MFIGKALSFVFYEMHLISPGTCLLIILAGLVVIWLLMRR